MITTLIMLLVVALVLVLIYYVVGMFIGGRPLQIIGVILALLFILYVLRAFNILAL